MGFQAPGHGRPLDRHRARAGFPARPGSEPPRWPPGCVREAVAMTAYAAGKYGEALREFRTYRRISGSNVHLPMMADCERGLGRPDRALDLIRSEEAARPGHRRQGGVGHC